MEKIKLNNQVVRMRKYVKQAKVHVINKLVKQVKLLHNRKGSEIQIQKAKRKAERFLEEIILLKKIKPDDVSKLALSKARDWKDILKQKNSTLPDRCIAMLANYGAVQKEVEVFYDTNKEFVFKITDLIKQWEEKNKFSKNSPKIEKMSGEKKIDKSILKANLKNENLVSETNTQSGAIVKKTNKLSKSENFQKSTLINKKHTLKKKNENTVADEQNEMSSIESPENTVYNKSSEQELYSNDDDIENALELNKSNSDEDPVESKLEINEPNSDENPVESTLEINESNIDVDPRENTVEAKELHNNKNEENSMEIESDTDNEDNSINEDSTSNDDITERKESNDLRNEDSDLNKPQESHVSEFIKKKMRVDNSSEKKLKAITLLNLDELQGLDEIPVSNTSENDESVEEGASEEEAADASQNKRNDPFFLGHGSTDSEEEKLVNSSKDQDFIPRNKNPVFSYNSRTEREKSSFFQKQEKSNHQFGHKSNFQKFPNGPRRDSTKLKNEKANFTSFKKKDKFMPRNYHDDKFQKKSKSAFDRDSFKNKKDFKMKHKMFPPRETDRKWKYEGNSNDLYHRNGGANFSAKNNVPLKKDNACDKPLHPSWEAKRKQKELINTSFQGKRIVFDN